MKFCVDVGLVMIGGCSSGVERVCVWARVDEAAGSEPSLYVRQEGERGLRMRVFFGFFVSLGREDCGIYMFGVNDRFYWIGF